MLDQFLYWFGNVQTLWALGLPKLAKWLLRRRRGVVRAGGFLFFPDREALRSVWSTLPARFDGVASADAIFMTGHELYRGTENLHVVKRVLLPNPTNTGALKWFCETVDSGDSITAIREMTRRAQKAGAKVKYHPHFMFHSMILADTDRPTGWAHFELILPYCNRDRRPSFTIYKHRSAQTVEEAKRIFDEIWEKATPAPES